MWGEGQIVLTGDEVRAVELWWTNSNEVTATARARWSLCIPLQFIEGAKLVDQKVKVLWLEPTKIMLKKRMLRRDLYGHNLYGGEGSSRPACTRSRAWTKALKLQLRVGVSSSFDGLKRS